MGERGTESRRFSSLERGGGREGGKEGMSCVVFDRSAKMEEDGRARNRVQTLQFTRKE